MDLVNVALGVPGVYVQSRTERFLASSEKSEDMPGATVETMRCIDE
jgi:hypothetical protein